MNYIRELLYRPKRSDKSLMAKFYFADLNLNAVASELDSFDGRKDPERCSCLVNRLRVCQDRLLSICNKMLEEIDAGYSAGQREFRAKFPDDIMTDNLAGQLWFGAECLAAGSSIMHKEDESDAMRPLARAVTKSLEKVTTNVLFAFVSQFTFINRADENWCLTFLQFPHLLCAIFIARLQFFLLH